MRVVDLFCGTGGFSTGAHAAGFNVAHAIDVDPVLTSTFRSNFPGVEITLCDIAELTGSDLRRSIDKPIDELIGGPPCQGFSVIGRRDGSDPRRLLLHHFFRLVAELRPTFFVMENVVGLMHGASRAVLDDAMDRIPPAYRLVGPKVLDAADFGVPTNRRRVFIIGVLPDRSDMPLLAPPPEIARVTVREAIADLADAVLIGEDEDGFDLHELPGNSAVSAYAAALRSPDSRFTGNQRTAHTGAVTERFASIPPGKTDPVGRHQRLSWEGLCPTLRAGTGADRGSYQSVRPLHPSEPRVITVREAARLQGFPDRHRFHPTIWHSFRMIGNSVSPPVAAWILRRVAEACGGATDGLANVAAE